MPLTPEENEYYDQLIAYNKHKFCRKCGQALLPEVKNTLSVYYNRETGNPVYSWSKKCPNFTSYAVADYNRHDSVYITREEFNGSV